MEKSEKQTKYIFVTGGVASSLGKGIIAASLAKLLQARGYSVTNQKCDPYINADDIACFDDLGIGCNAVDNDIVQGNTDICREAAVSEKGGLPAEGPADRSGGHIQFFG